MTSFQGAAQAPTAAVQWEELPTAAGFSTVQQGLCSEVADTVVCSAQQDLARQPGQQDQRDYGAQLPLVEAEVSFRTMTGRPTIFSVKPHTGRGDAIPDMSIRRSK